MNKQKIGQNDENEFALSTGESSDDEEERIEEEEKARKTFSSIASDGADDIATDEFQNYLKRWGRHMTRKNIVMTEEDLDLSCKKESMTMKSEEEIAAVFSKFTSQEGSWNPDTVKCGACEALNPTASKELASGMATSVTSGGSIGSSGFSFPVSTALDSTSSFSFGGILASNNDTASEVKLFDVSFRDTAHSWGACFGKAKASYIWGSTTTVVFEKAKGFLFAGSVKPAEDSPSSRRKGQLWKRIIDFNQSLQRVNQSVSNALSTDQEFALKTVSKVDDLRAKLSDFCQEIIFFNELRDQIEKRMFCT
ncbi:hypothetical protein CCR75_004154 [Bremia lactucae]|uniref:Uncharacterized protein n=1 Tax=Bremia lactucae TaxID=4779 RepID=A0A976FIR8_BRELC|nr:hypothetical protein CCR75_004154 [Bremia lactucae]